MKQYQKALEYYIKGLKIFKKVCENHPDTAISYNNIGGIYYNMGQFSEALDNYE
jgi:tetratricopeptide (TPR) repeat protein